MIKRRYSLMDQVLTQVNLAMNTVFVSHQAARSVSKVTDQAVTLSEQERQCSAGMMRVNHSGEVCAQALYQGQLLTARDQQTRAMLSQACAEETDHLAWTEQRLQQLHSHRSYLNLFWYINAYCIGVFAGLLGDRYSLGFVEETEHQVAEHLARHLTKLPEKDQTSRKIIQQMRADEMAHGQAAHTHGATELPKVVKRLMRLHAKVMTGLAYYI